MLEKSIPLSWLMSHDAIIGAFPHPAAPGP
jgi:hypothetical protein